MKHFYKLRWFIYKYTFLTLFGGMAVLFYIFFFKAPSLTNFFIWFALGFTYVFGMYFKTAHSIHPLDKVKSLSKTLNISMQDFEADFQHAQKVNWRIRLGEKYIFFFNTAYQPDILKRDMIQHVQYISKSAPRGGSLKIVRFLDASSQPLADVYCRHKVFKKYYE